MFFILFLLTQFSISFSSFENVYEKCSSIYISSGLCAIEDKVGFVIHSLTNLFYQKEQCVSIGASFKGFLYEDEEKNKIWSIYSRPEYTEVKANNYTTVSFYKYLALNPDKFKLIKNSGLILEEGNIDYLLRFNALGISKDVTRIHNINSSFWISFSLFKTRNIEIKSYIENATSCLIPENRKDTVSEAVKNTDVIQIDSTGSSCFTCIYGQINKCETKSIFFGLSIKSYLKNIRIELLSYVSAVNSFNVEGNVFILNKQNTVQSVSCGDNIVFIDNSVFDWNISYAFKEQLSLSIDKKISNIWSIKFGTNIEKIFYIKNAIDKPYSYSESFFEDDLFLEDALTNWVNKLSMSVCMHFGIEGNLC